MITGLMSVMLMIIILLGIVLAFEIWMFIDAINNQNLSHDERFLWLLGMLFLHPFVAIAYYFIARNPRD